MLFSKAFTFSTCILAEVCKGNKNKREITTRTLISDFEDRYSNQLNYLPV